MNNNINTSTEDWISIGKIIKPHGLKGELKINLQTEADLSNVQIKIKDLKFKIKDFRRTGTGFAMIKVQGIDSIEEAEKYINSEILLKKDILLDDEFFIADIIGMKALDYLTEKPIGIIKSIQNVPLKPVLEITHSEQSDKDFFIPFLLGVYVYDIDIKGKILKLKDWEFFV